MTAFLAVFPPARVNVTVLVGEDTLTVAPAVLPVAVILTNVVVSHLANAGLCVFVPVTLVAMARLVVVVDAGALSSTVDEVTNVGVTVLVRRSTLASEATRARLQLVVLRTKLILTFFTSLRHDSEGVDF